MSLIPTRMLREMMRPLRMMENQLRLAEEEFFRPSTVFRNRPRFVELPEELSSESVIQDKDKFQVKLDVQDFKPEEIQVKTVGENAIEIEAKHAEKQDEHGFVARHLVRRFILPKGHDLKSAVSNLTPDGVLTITAPRKQQLQMEEKKIPITHIEAGKEEVKN